MKKLATTLATTVAALAFAATPSSAVLAFPSPQDADPFLSVRTQGGNYPLSVYATNMRQSDSTPIVISSATPSVCTVPVNSSAVGTYEETPTFRVTVVGRGTCTLQADQAGSARYVAGHAERSYSVR
jgi:hypothetical protein